MFETLHKTYLKTDAERICKNINASFIQVERSTWLINGKLFDNLKLMLEYIYNLEAKK